MNSEFRKILIIDDEERTLDLYLRFFVESGFITRRAKDASTATNIIIREQIDLVLLDISMPGVDGKAMFDIIREYNPELKVIVMSVYPISKQKQMIPGANSFFNKSQGPSALLELVHQELIQESLLVPDY